MRPPVKLWSGTTKRQAKKGLGRHWKKLNFGRTLKPGDVVSTCNGWNERIETIEPIYRSGGRYKGRRVVDFHITTKSMSHSMTHCCDDHLLSRAEIVAYWLAWDTPSKRAWYEWWSGGQDWADSSWGKIALALRSGKEVFDFNGMPIEEPEPEVCPLS